MSYINKPPKNKNGVIPTKNGWIDAKTKEMLVSVKINPELIEQWKPDSLIKTDLSKKSEKLLENNKMMEKDISSDDKETAESSDENTDIKKIIRKSTVKRKRIV